MTDPRLGDAAVTVSEKLLDRAIRHATFLERLKAGEVRRINEFIEQELYPQILRRAETMVNRAITGQSRSLRSTQRLIDQTRALEEFISRRIGELRKDFTKRMQELAKMEGNALVNTLDDAIPNVLGLEYTLPSVSTLRSVVTSRPVRGRFLKTWFDDLDRSTQRLVEEVLNTGIAQGQSATRIAQRLRGTRAGGFTDGAIQTTRRHAESIARTAISHSANHARSVAMQENTDIIKNERYVAALDARTTPICASLDGRIFPVGEGEIPPMHHQCRSVRVPVVKTLKELGFDVGDVPPSTRAAFGGPVSDNVTYFQWARQQPPSVLNNVLGKRWATEFRAGRITADDVHRIAVRQARPLTLAALDALLAA